MNARLHPRLAIVPSRDDRPATVAAVAAELAAEGHVPVIVAAGALLDAALELDGRHRRDAVAAAERSSEARARLDRLEAALAEARELADREVAVARELSEAEDTVAARRSALDAANGRLSELESRRAAAAQAVAAAGRELASLETLATGDDADLRRALEQAHAELRAAEHDSLAAEAALEAAEAELAAVRARQEARRADRQAAAPSEDPFAGAEAMRAAIGAFDADPGGRHPHPEAADLAERIRAVEQGAASMVSGYAPPAPEVVTFAEQRLRAAEEALDVAVRAAEASRLGDDFVAAVEAAHTELEALSARTKGRFGRAAAEERLAAAEAAELALLESRGFNSYTEYALRRAAPDGDAKRALKAARDELVEAGNVLAELRRKAEPPPGLVEAAAEHQRLSDLASGLLGCDPGEKLLELLDFHPAVEPSTLAQLRDALAVTGAPVPVGIGLRAAAVAWLGELDRRCAADQEARRRLTAAQADLAALDRASRLADDRRTATDAARAAAAAATEGARARVAQLELELSHRAGPGASRPDRAEAAAGLRAQIDAVQTALARSEDEHQRCVAGAHDALAAAEAELHRCRTAAVAAERRLERLAELVGLPVSVGASAVHTAIETARHDATDDARLAAEALGSAGTSLDLTPEPVHHLVAALRSAIGTRAGAPVVLDADAVLPDETLLALAAEARIVVITDDPTTIGWAIELPAEVGALAPAPTKQEL